MANPLPWRESERTRVCVRLDNPAEFKAHDSEKEAHVETIKINGMSCKHCVMAVQKALSSLDGVTDVSVDLDKGEASFQREAGTPVSLIHDAIRLEGYEIG